MKTIIVPLDGSALAEQVLPYVIPLAQALQAGVRLLQVVAPALRVAGLQEGDWDEGGALGSYERVDWQTPREYAECYLAAHAARLRAAGLSAVGEVRFGEAADVIAEVAADRRTALVAMATHGYSGLRRWALGSVAEQVVRASRAPVLLVRGADGPTPAPHRLRRILVPLDGSEFARQAIPPALDLAVGAGAELVALQSVAPSIEEYIGAPALVDQRAELCGQLERAYAARSGLPSSTHAPIVPIVTVGAAADAIVEEAERRRADMIVMATHAYGGLRRWIAGSVADTVLHTTRIPLLLVHARPNEG
jgi:nucleotide-binding universal stress UspA family protein